jgi:membrane protease YdiL (CAAX protease family)
MTIFDDTPPGPPLDEPIVNSPEQPRSSEPISASLAGDPIVYAASAPGGAYDSNATLPEDLRISWSWPHLVLFLFFSGASFVVIQTALFFYYGPRRPMPKEELERYLLNKPQFIFGTNLLWYAAVFFFLYITLSVLRDSPFWSSLGWKKLKSSFSQTWGGPWSYFFGGCALAIFVGLASSRVHTNDSMPIQELFKNRENAVLLMCMAVLVAPLVEETVFRGYLYPLLARFIFNVTRHFAMDLSQSRRVAVRASIVLTGVLFGLMHGAQLGWSWGIVGLLIIVGIIFTSVRARTGTVLASFLLHLGYNSMIAVTTIVGTHGFTRIPTGP